MSQLLSRCRRSKSALDCAILQKGQAGLSRARKEEHLLWSISCAENKFLPAPPTDIRKTNGRGSEKNNQEVAPN